MSVLDKTLLTTVGAAKYAYNDTNTLPTNFLEIALGDNNGADFIPAITDGNCVHEVYRANINSLTIDPTDPTIVIVQLVLPANVGGFTVREARIYDVDGVVMYTANPYFVKSLGSSDQNLLFRIKRSSTSAVTLLVDPSITLASQLYVNNAITVHNADAAAHAAALFATKLGVQNQAYSYAVATGTTSAYLASFSPAITALVGGAKVTLDTTTVGTNTTTAPTFSPNGLTALAIVKESGALAVGDMPKFAQLQANATATQWILLNPVSKGVLLAVKKYTTVGTFTYTPTTGCIYYIAKGVGAGAGGMPSVATGAGQVSAGSGGSAGYYGEGMYLNVGNQTVTIGAGGASGVAGGTTSLGTQLTLTGGAAGSATTAAVAPVLFQGGGGMTGTATGANILSVAGAMGESGVGFSSTSGKSGNGASSPFGRGGSPAYLSSPSAGNVGLGQGAGGSGGATGSSGTANAGGAGSSGGLYIWEYA